MKLLFLIGFNPVSVLAFSNACNGIAYAGRLREANKLSPHSPKLWCRGSPGPPIRCRCRDPHCRIFRLTYRIASPPHRILINSSPSVTPLLELPRKPRMARVDHTENLGVDETEMKGKVEGKVDGKRGGQGREKL